jgi:hypothetical protein
MEHPADSKVHTEFRCKGGCLCEQVPFSYIWSEALVPKPEDWGPELDVVGYIHLHEGKRTHYQPPAELAAFLASGPAPIYIGKSPSAFVCSQHLCACDVE